MNVTEEYFKLHATCIPVKGIKRSVICDLTRRRLDFIPNALYYILVKLKNKNISEIKNIFKNKQNEFIDEYFDFLVTNEYGMYISKEELKLFPPINLSFDYPSEISNCILEIDENSLHDYKNIFSQLKQLSTYFVEMRFHSSFSIDEIFKILSDCDADEMNLSLLLQYHKSFSVENIEKLHVSFSINTIDIYNCPDNTNDDYESLKKFFPLNIFNNKMSNKCCGSISTSLFQINIPTFTESLRFNSCLNRKLSINSLGEIKNCPSMQSNYGSIKDNSLVEVLKENHLQKYWEIKKDDIHICRDCEFRHVCTDCRAYIENPDDINSKPLKCGYNPYLNKWEDWSTNPLKKMAMEYYQI